MRIERMRPTHTDAKLAELYATPHDHTKFDDHLLRVDATIAVAKWILRDHNPEADLTIADLSTGNAAIPYGIAEHYAGAQLILGDFARGYQHVGSIEHTIWSIDRRVDLFVCSETVEHLDDPWAVLREIRSRSERLVLSTPIDEKLEDENEEHYWAWDVEGVAEMLRTTGWSPVTRTDVTFNEWFFPYNFQIWGCK